PYLRCSPLTVPDPHICRSACRGQSVLAFRCPVRTPAPSTAPSQDGSSVGALLAVSRLPAPEPASVPGFSESVDPVTPAGLAAVGWPTAPAPTTAVGLFPPVATAPSYAALLRSRPARATDS